MMETEAQDQGTAPRTPEETSLDGSAERSSDGASEALEGALSEARKLKEEGNSLYKRGMTFAKHTLGKNTMVEACSKYASALEILLEKKQESVPYEGEVRELLIAVYLNLAAAGMQLDSPDSAVNCCNAVLEIEPKHTKALFRRARALSAQENYEDAIHDLDVALSTPNVDQRSAKDLGLELKRTKAKLAKKLQAQAFKQETEEGRRRQAKTSQPIVEPEETHTEASTNEPLANEPDVRSQKPPVCPVTEVPSESWVQGLGLGSYVQNGAILATYAWGQSLDALHILIPVAQGTRSKQVNCTLKRLSVQLEVAGIRLLDLNCYYPITVHESIWELEDERCVHLTLHKEHATREQEPGFEWWPSPFQGEPTVDVAECHVGNDMRELPSQAKQEMAKVFQEEQAKTPEERKLDEERRKAEFNAKQEAERIEKSVERAMSDPKKKAVYDLFQKSFPDVPVEFR